MNFSPFDSFPRPRFLTPDSCPLIPVPLIMILPPSIAKIHAAFRERELSPRELVEQCLTNIDSQEASVRAWVMIDRDGAVATADAQTDWLERSLDSLPLPPLFGIPVGIKDIIDVASWPTQAGSSLREAHVATTDATLVARLRAAGAILLGKTVTTEFASFDPAVTRNPWQLGRTPGGSSSGSAAAVCSGMCVAAVGTQTGGSILRPAAYCGVVGFKPSHGLVPIEGVVPVAPSLDHVGPIGRYVADVARLFGVMAQFSGKTAAVSLATPIRFGVVRDFFYNRAEPETAAIFDAVMVHLENELGSASDVTLPIEMHNIHSAHHCIMAYECRGLSSRKFLAASFELCSQRCNPNRARSGDVG